jgi:hypothetical protein
MFQAAGQNVDELAKCGRMVAAVMETIRCEGRQDLTPARGVEQRRILWKGLRPVARERGENFALAAQ